MEAGLEVVGGNESFPYFFFYTCRKMGNLTSTSNPILRKLEADRMYQQKQLSSDPYVTFSQLGSYAKTTDLSSFAKNSDFANYYTKDQSDSRYVIDYSKK